MSTASSYDNALGFLSEAPAKAASKKAPPLGLIGTLRAVAEAMSEGLAAERRYQQLVVRGIAPSEAAARVFNEHYTTT